METRAYYPFGLPLYVLLVVVERAVARRRGLPTLSFAPSMSNVSSGVGSIVMGLALGPMWLALYAWGSQTFALFHLRARPHGCGHRCEGARLPRKAHGRRACTSAAGARIA